MAELINTNSYPSTWILKLLLEIPKPSPSGNDNTTSISTTPTNTTSISTIPASIIDNSINKGEIGIDSYKLNKLNIGKPGFIENKEMIIRYKFKYFRKNDKKD